MKPPEGRMICTYCGQQNPDSEAVCPNTGGRHSLISSSDKQELGQGKGPGPGIPSDNIDPRASVGQKSKEAARKLDIPEDYKRAYNKGWAASSRGAMSAPSSRSFANSPLENLDAKGAGEAAYDGYLDEAAGREKWHTYHCRAAGGCWEHQWGTPKEAHGFAQTDTVKHCPFCGSGDVWGGSDGTITSEFDGATFQVSVEPQYPSAPGSINGMPMNIDGEPDMGGQAMGDDMSADAEGAAVPSGLDPSAGEDLGGDEEDEGEDEDSGGGPPWAKGDNDDEDEDDDEGEDEGSGAPFRTGAYRTFAGDILPEELYLKHLAIRHAEEPRLFLASLRSGR